MNFDRLAPFYSAIEHLTTGSRMQRSRVAHLDKVGDARRILIAGEGNGRFLAACATALPEAHFTVIDESSAMLRQAAKRWRQAGGKTENLRLIQANLLDWSPDQADYNLIVIHFFLDCFPAESLPGIVEKLSSAATPDARWLLADFCEPPREAGILARWRARLTLRAAYVIFRLVAGISARRLTAPDAFLQKQGFSLSHRTFSDWGMMHSDLWSRAS